MSKKVKASNVIMDCIIGGVVLVLLVVAVAMGGNHDGDESGGTGGKDGVAVYRCVIDDASSNNTVFSLEFHKKDMTYREFLEAGDKSTELDRGSYREEDGKWITTSEKGKDTVTYFRDGDYLLAEEAMYQGKLPKGNLFDATFTYEEAGVMKSTLQFKMDGTYVNTVLSYGSKGEGDRAQDTTKTTRGTYQRKKKSISRKENGSGGTLLDFYIYGDRITNAYYKLEENG